MGKECSEDAEDAVWRIGFVVPGLRKSFQAQPSASTDPEHAASLARRAVLLSVLQRGS